MLEDKWISCLKTLPEGGSFVRWKDERNIEMYFIWTSEENDSYEEDFYQIIFTKEEVKEHLLKIIEK